MRIQVRVELGVSWPEARRQLPRALYAQLAPFLTDHELADFWPAAFVFDAAAVPLAELLTYAAARHVRPALLSRLAGHRRLPLLRRVRRWPVYDFAELAHEPVVQLVVERQIDLAPPLTAYYRPEPRRAALCPQCDVVDLRQVSDLTLVPDSPWPPLVAAANHELVITDDVYQRWRAWAELPVRPVRQAGAAAIPMWQVLPQGVVALAEPATLLHARTSCPACGRPTVVALYPSTQAGVTAYEEEPILCLPRGALPDGDYWETSAQVGRIRSERDLLERMATDSEPFCVRMAEPFRLISGRLLRLLHEAQQACTPAVCHWRCKPIRWGR